MLRGFLQLAGDFLGAWEVSNIFVSNKWSAWEGYFAVVLEFWRDWGGCKQDVLELCFWVMGNRKVKLI
ncbi:hypothetical protein BOQ62_17250 [Chryseobacterium sp. CH21]|nr:hypothetical protein BOQ62_17250 [Chryseobacterium sp. CH21]